MIKDEISKVRVKKKELEILLTNAVKQFTKETGLNVSKIHLAGVDGYSGDFQLISVTTEITFPKI